MLNVSLSFSPLFRFGKVTVKTANCSDWQPPAEYTTQMAVHFLKVFIVTLIPRSNQSHGHTYLLSESEK